MSNKKRVTDIDTLVSIFGFGGDILTKLAKAVEARGGNIDTMRRLISEPELCDRIADLLVGGLKQLIKACGFVFVDPDITEEHFPMTGPVAAVEEMFLVSQKDLSGSNMRTDEIEAAIDRLGFRSVTLAEQLVWAPVCWNGTDMVVALGSSWVYDGMLRRVPYLCEGRDGRKLSLRLASRNYCWHEDYWFLVVRK